MVLSVTAGRKAPYELGHWGSTRRNSDTRQKKNRLGGEVSWLYTVTTYLLLQAPFTTKSTAAVRCIKRPCCFKGWPFASYTHKIHRAAQSTALAGMPNASNNKAHGCEMCGFFCSWRHLKHPSRVLYLRASTNLRLWVGRASLKPGLLDSTACYLAMTLVSARAAQAYRHQTMPGAAVHCAFAYVAAGSATANPWYDAVASIAFTASSYSATLGLATRRNTLACLTRGCLRDSGGSAKTVGGSFTDADNAERLGSKWQNYRHG
jgi:hypothetical protein